MYRHRYLILPLILALFLGSIAAIPTRGLSAGSAVEVRPREMDLPLYVGQWRGKLGTPTADERRILSEDTRFAKASYYRQRGTIVPVYDQISASIVLSGSDLNNSIHRPERCLPAQGHYNLTARTLELELANGIVLPVTRLRTKVNVLVDAENADSKVPVDCLNYYFFVGHELITHSHYQRTITDMRDRLFYGRDQRWAYVQLGINYGNPDFGLYLDEERADQAIQDLLRDLVPKVINWQQITKIDVK